MKGQEAGPGLVCWRKGKGPGGHRRGLSGVIGRQWGQRSDRQIIHCLVGCGEGAA